MLEVIIYGCVVFAVCILFVYLFFALNGAANRTKHPTYHKKNGKKLSVFIYGISRSNGGGCYTEFLFERGADGTYVKCKDEKQEKELLFGLKFFAFIFGVFCIFLLVTKNADLLGILFMLLFFAVCVGFGYIMYKRDIKKAKKYIKEQGLD